MRFFSRFSPTAAYRDLRLFFETRERYEFGFLALAMAITGFLVWAFVRDSHVEVPYVAHVTYVKSWRLDRSDAEIKTQQIIDEAAKRRREAAIADEREKNRLQFKRLDDSLTNMGI